MTIPWTNHPAHYQTIRTEVDNAIQKVLERGRYTMGEQVRGFEEAFAAYCGVRYGVSVGSGSDAIRISLAALGIGEGDDVISVANSCWSVPLAIAHSGARIVLVDIEEQTYNIDPRLIEEAITPRTRAVLAMHGHGIPCQIGPILDTARRYGLAVIEDGAVAVGATYKEERVGRFGDVCVFSFGAGKMLTSYGNNAGIVVTNSPEIADRIRLLANYGTRLVREDDVVPEAYRLSGTVCTELGFHSHLDELQAAILRVKLEQLDPWLEGRRDRARLYGRLLADLPVVMPSIPDHMEAVYRGYLIRAPDRDELYRHLQSRGIQAALLYLPPVHLQPAFSYLGYEEGDFPVTETVAREMLSLPIYPELADDQVKVVVGEIRDLYTKTPAAFEGRGGPERACDDSSTLCCGTDQLCDPLVGTAGAIPDSTPT
jgi:dTDP-4-amino-4,6-dideoxygalactose transaminase